jgi:glycosyltransferase involved in cell wall biosynthesis
MIEEYVQRHRDIRPNTVLSVIHGGTFGGPCNEILTLASGLPSIRFVVVLPDEPGEAADRLMSAGVSVVRQPMVRLRKGQGLAFWILFPFRFTRDVVALARLARRWQADIVQGYGINLQAAFAARLARRPLLWSVVDSFAPRSIRAVLVRIVRRSAKAVLLDGRAIGVAYRGIDQGLARAVVYYPPVDLTQFQPTTGAERSTGPVVIGTVANLGPAKGLEFFLDAASIVLASCDARFEVTGAEHPGHERLARRLVARARGVPDGRFRFLGATDDVPARLHALDIFVISSLHEGTTTTALEAMACGLPVVATAIGGIPEVVEDGMTGILVPPADPEALAAAILRLAADDQLRHGMGHRGRKRVESLFGSSRFVAQVLFAYGVVLETHPGRARKSMTGDRP